MMTSIAPDFSTLGRVDCALTWGIGDQQPADNQTIGLTPTESGGKQTSVPGRVQGHRGITRLARTLRVTSARETRGKLQPAHRQALPRDGGDVITSSYRANGGATSQSAARILILLDKLGDAPTESDRTVMPGCVAVVRAQSRLAKLDFWLRNPDYLADELLTDVAAGLLDHTTAVPAIQRMLAGQAPEMHIYPMQRYRFGAWEIPDNALAVLKFYGMVDHRRAADVTTSNAGTARRDYFLLDSGTEALTRIRATVDHVHWYDRQAEAIALLEASATGAAARKRQYEQPQYAATPIGANIESILDVTRERFARLAAEHGWSTNEVAATS